MLLYCLGIFEYGSFVFLFAVLATHPFFPSDFKQVLFPIEVGTMMIQKMKKSMRVRTNYFVIVKRKIKSLHSYL